MPAKEDPNQIFTANDVSSGSSGCDRVLVSYKGKVFDVAAFLLDHPGGPDILLQYSGCDMEVLLYI